MPACLAFLFSFSSFSQLTEIKPTKATGLVKRGPYQIAKLTSPGSDMHLLTYLDAGYQSIDVYNTIMFDADDKVMNDVYTIFKQQLEAEKNTEKSFGLGDSTIKLVTKKALGSPYLVVYIASHGKAGYMNLQSNEVDKLFGK